MFRLEPSRPNDSLGTHEQRDDWIGDVFQWGWAIAGYTCNVGAASFRLSQPAELVRRPAAGGHANNRVARAHIQTSDIARASIGIILRAFDRMGKGAFTPGDERLHPIRCHAKGGQDFRSVERPEVPAPM